MTLRATIRLYLTDLLSAGNVVIADATDAFIHSHADLINEHADRLVHAAIRAEFKNLCANRPEDEGQLALFAGLPAAIVIADGIAKPLNRCTWDDLQVGRRERVENIAHAEKSLEAYDRELDLLRPHLATSPDKTVGEVRGAIASESAA